MAAKLARLLYRMLRYGMPFIDRGAEFTTPSTANCKSTISSAKPPISDFKSSKLRERSRWRGSFPADLGTDRENRDLRQPLWHRHRVVQAHPHQRQCQSFTPSQAGTIVSPDQILAVLDESCHLAWLPLSRSGCSATQDGRSKNPARFTYDTADRIRPICSRPTRFEWLVLGRTRRHGYAAITLYRRES